ncbi:hypothetical protein QWZ13_09555 [Reinekea marina]|uniref:hypothetical protein n=1 Tax=Reinekea marina TaxID=1310421 RepID=UPI0025B43CA2|nr:hypothetical protein [Reinekea marina]MDN3649155.1 hypothetical protein [Reinekea marina]
MGMRCVGWIRWGWKLKKQTLMVGLNLGFLEHMHIHSSVSILKIKVMMRIHQREDFLVLVIKKVF